MTRIPLLDLRRQDQAVDAELVDAFRRVLESGCYILGPEVEAFERECARYLGVEHAVGVSSGTDALLLSLMTLGIGRGDEVIVPTYTFFATAGAVARTGATPVFADVDPRSFNCTADAIASRITGRTKAIVVVHLFGQCADMDPILALATNRGVPVVEDAAQAIGARHRGRNAGAMGAFGCFSFFPSKNLGAMGDAGLVTTNDAALAHRARISRVHGASPKYHHHLVGGNFRLDALQAALLRVKLPHLEEATERRRANAELYQRCFAALEFAAPNDGDLHGNAVLLWPTCLQERHVYNQYVVRVARAGARDRLRAFLDERGIGTEVYYPIPMHLQACFSELGHRKGDFPDAETLADESLALPIFPELQADEIRRIVGHIAEFFA